MTAPPLGPDSRGAPAPSGAGRAGRLDLLAAVLVALAALGMYNANQRMIATGDTYPARFVPLAVLHAGTVYLDSIASFARMGRAPEPYWLIKAPARRLASAYPLVTPLLVTPLYLPAVLYLDRQGWGHQALVQQTAEWMEKAAASCVAAVGAGLMFWLLRRQLPRGRALLLAAAFALGTETWAVSSQALWQHGVAELLVIVALLAASGEPTAARLVIAGVACGLLIANRPPDVLLAAPFAFYALFWVRPVRRALPFFAAAAVPLAVTLGYDLLTFHNLGGGYSFVLAHSTGASGFFEYPLWNGVAGQLVSPAKGLFFFSPFLLWLAVYLRGRVEPPGGRRLLAASLAVGMALQVVLYAKTDWRGGYSYGPRYLTDLVPALIWLLAPVVASLRRVNLAAFAVAAAFAIYVQGVGAFCYPNPKRLSDDLYYKDSVAGRAWSNIWKPEDAAFVVEAE